MLYYYFRYTVSIPIDIWRYYLSEFRTYCPHLPGDSLRGARPKPLRHSNLARFLLYRQTFPLTSVTLPLYGRNSLRHNALPYEECSHGRFFPRRKRFPLTAQIIAAQRLSDGKRFLLTGADSGRLPPVRAGFY